MLCDFYVVFGFKLDFYRLSKVFVGFLVYIITWRLLYQSSFWILGDLCSRKKYPGTNF